mmetsp:Transcript_48828/g.156401  ORF Transcript_48828/g.156401 Transcript_48828/m.156401 type:complete len:97 (+) Transcript_48828:194-484(+)
MPPLGSFKYTIHGKVQGVYFRKYTDEHARSLGLVGWVMNTDAGTVVGEAQGDKGNLAKMRVWLASKGSPKSTITKAEFSDERAVEALDYSKFEVRR